MVILNGGAPFVAPYGGVSKRLPPNPLSIAVPCGHGVMPMLDITTSMAAGGKVAVYGARGLPVPDGWLVDADGNPVYEAKRLMGEADVAMLPMGGSVGHKGYGLAFMIDALAGGLTWAGCSAESPTRGGGGGGGGAQAAILRWPSRSTASSTSTISSTRLTRWWTGSNRRPTMPGVDQVLIPGEIEEMNKAKRMAEGIEVEQGDVGCDRQLRRFRRR